MKTINRFAFLLSICLTTIAGCDADSTESDEEFRSAGYVAPWSSVKCLSGTKSRCLAQSPSSGDTIQPVVSWCDLHARTWAGTLVPTNDGWWHECDLDGRPEAFDDAICFYDSVANVVCYGGSGGWYTEVKPACNPTSFTAVAWPTGTCDPDSSPGPHSFDKIKTVPYGTPWWGLASDGGDAFHAEPSCMSASGVVAADPYWCEVGTLYPCCTCNSGNAVVCLVSDEFGQCPAGYTKDHMTECA